MNRSFERGLARLLASADAALNRLYGWRYNPLYQSGTIVVVLFLVLLATGLWLLLFYRVGAPWASVAGLTANLWWGNWVRGLHRYASDAALLAALVHMFRMFAQGRSWGPRALAWVTGVTLLGVTLICGWTGFVMVWDSFGRELAVEGARWLDALPIFSEPVRRTFAGERPVPGVFFFLNLFLHVGLPLAAGLLLWLHVSRLARPTLLPPRRLLWAVVGLLTAVAVAWPLDMAPEANPLVLPTSVPTDWFYAFWLPLTRRLPPVAIWLGGTAVGVGLLIVPRLTRRQGADRPLPSAVNEELCTGCTQCSLDCPYEAIAMAPRTDGRADVVARINPVLCVSCGICAGSCAPMGVGPPGRTGRDQLSAVRRVLGSSGDFAGRVLVVACDHGAGMLAPLLERDGVTLFPVPCVGNLHTSVIEFAIRSGASGVLVLSCPPRDCRNREGPRWLGERVHHDREAELQPRVDRRRVAIVPATAGDRAAVVGALRAFQEELVSLDRPGAEAAVEIDAVCEPPVEEEVS
jgi:ferredoxin